MKPVMMQQDQEPEEDQSMAEESSQEPELPYDAMKIVSGAKAILFSDEMAENFQQMVGKAKDFATAASMVCFSLISKAQDSLQLDLPPDLLYGDGGVSDHLMDAIYGYGQQLGIEEASDQQSYIQAMDMVEDLGMRMEQGAGMPAKNQGAKSGAPIMMG